MRENATFKTICEQVFFSVKCIKATFWRPVFLIFMGYIILKKNNTYILENEPAVIGFSLSKFGAQGESYLCLLIASENTT